MTPDEILALAALALFFVVALWLGLTQPDAPLNAKARPDRPASGLLDHAGFALRPLQTPEETRLCALLDSHLAQRGDGFRALPQAALAALLRPVPSGQQARDSAVAAAIATRRLDIAILDCRGRLAAAVMQRPPDLVTRTALDRADVPIVTVSRDDTDTDLAARLDAAIARAEWPLSA